MTLQISFFGGYRLSQRDVGVSFTSQRKVMALLAFLALEAAQVHSREILIGLLWPELPEADARNNLRVSLARLRKLLDEGPAKDSPLITSRRDVGFRLSQAVVLDVVGFESLLAQTEAHAHAARPGCAVCRENLAAAVALYRGPLLRGFYLDDCPGFEEWLFVRRERLLLQVMGALEDLAQGLEKDGRYPEATAYTRRQLELDPLHDSAQYRLLRLLAYQDQHNLALQQYQVFRTALRHDLGIEPSVELMQLAQQIQDRRLPAPQAAPAPASIVYRHNLPENMTPFFSREAELAELAQRLAKPGYRLITLVGPGGIGKTRLALEAARNNLRRYADGAFFVPLEGVANASEIPAAIAGAMDVPFGSARSPRTEILHILRDRQILLVIDNLEHIIEEGAALLLDILQSAPEVVLLVTSRERLNVQTEDLFYLTGLPYPEQDDDPASTRFAAIRLFADRAHRINKAFKLSPETVVAVAQICRLVEGLPLGIELAAVWVRELDVQQIAGSLADNFALLDTDLRDISPRHRNLAVVFEHSWDLLTPDEQAVLPRLALFRGGFTMDAAINVANASTLTLTRLYSKSLIAVSGNRRYRMHELLRQFALRKLQEDQEATGRLQDQHSHYYLTLLAAEEQQFQGPEAARVSSALRLEIDNIRQAWRWALSRAEWNRLRQSAAGLAAFFSHTGLIVEGTQLLHMAVESAEIDTAARSDLLPFLLTKQLSLLEWTASLEEAQPLVERIISLTRQNPALALLEAEAYLIWSYTVFEHTSDLRQAGVYLDRAFALVTDSDDPELQARLYNECGRHLMSNSQFDEAVAAFQTSLTLFKSLGHLPGQALTYDRLAGNYAEKYKLGPALEYGEKALRLYSQLDHRPRLGMVHFILAEIYTLLGVYDRAMKHARFSLQLSRQHASDKFGEARALARCALIEDRRGQTEEAEKSYRTVITALRKLKRNMELSLTLLDWGDFLLRAGRLAEAESSFDEALTLYQDMEHLRITSQAKLALVYLAQGEARQALALVDEIWQAIAARRGRGLPFPIDTLFACFTIFQACGDARATESLNQAEEVLKRTVAEIEDQEIREAFLNKVPVNRLLRTAL